MVMTRCGGGPRDAGDVSKRTQCELGHNEGFQCAFVATERSLSRQERSESRQAWRRACRAGNDDEEWEVDPRLLRRGRVRSGSRGRSRARAPAALALAAFGAFNALMRGPMDSSKEG